MDISSISSASSMVTSQTLENDVGVAVLRKAMDADKERAMQMIQDLQVQQNQIQQNNPNNVNPAQSLPPHLGNKVNTVA